jgi:hypothetical protein
MTLDPIPFELPEDLRARVDRELESGERLLWAGEGAPPLRTPGYLVATAIALVCWAFGLSILAWLSRPDAGRDRFSVIDAGLGVVGILALIVAVAISLSGLGFLVHFLIVRRRKLCRLYALTERRAILAVPADGRTGLEVSSIERGKVEHVRRLERDDGRCDLLFSVTFERYFGPTRFDGIVADPRVEALARSVLVVEPDRSPAP